MTRRAAPHPVDRVAGLLFDRGFGRVFTGGWGDPDLLDLLDASSPGAPAEVEPEWGSERQERGLSFREGTFSSPAVGLPPASATAHVLHVRPDEGTVGTVVLLAAWNEHSHLRRLLLAKLLAGQGLASLILENPFYGRRRVRAGMPIETVSDFAVMGRAAVDEARALMVWASAFGPTGVSGYSMGGNTSALAGAAMDQPVAIAPLAPSPSPGPVWTDGMIARSVDWERIGPNGPERLGEALGRASVLAIPPRPHTAHAVLVGALADGYIPRSATESLHDHWPGSELRWVQAGHGTLIWRHKRALAGAIVDSFDRLRTASS